MSKNVRFHLTKRRNVMKRIKRTSIKRPSNEAAVLRQMRISKKISTRKAAKLFVCSKAGLSKMPRPNQNHLSHRRSQSHQKNPKSLGPAINNTKTSACKGGLHYWTKLTYSNKNTPQISNNQQAVTAKPCPILPK